MKPFLLLLGLGAATAIRAATLTIDASHPAPAVSPLFYGLMTEEINYSYDGGLYAELIRNRSFQDDPQLPTHWALTTPSGAGAVMALDRQNPVRTTLPVSLRLTVTTASSAAPAGVANDGYWGIPVHPRTRYAISFFARAAGFTGPVTASLVSEDGRTVFAQTRVTGLTPDWHPFKATLNTDRRAPVTDRARLVLSVEAPGTVWFSLVSLFPPTWADQPNGFRPDLMQMLVDLHPKFLRLPGGNYLEGDTVAKRFDWKKTVGPLPERPGHQGPWGYRSSDGLGLMEYLRWCEDMKAEPVLAVFAGYALKGEHVAVGAPLEPYVQDALDEIEYVCGPADSHWGARRAADGHPAPFPLHYVEIGNEDFFDKSGSYPERFAQFFDAIKARYPQLKCISTVGNEQPGRLRVHNRQPDAVDEHYYRPADEVLRDAPGHYERYRRHGPEIFVGEWAAYETPFAPWDGRSRNSPPTPSMKAALADAAWMADLERNADLVKMNCYAPLLVNVHGRQWRPDLIGYDSLTVFGSPSYYAIQMFSGNIGDEVLPGILDQPGVQYSVTRDTRERVIYVKLVNPGNDSRVLRLQVKGVKSLKSSAETLTLAASPEATNSMTEPRNVVPVKGEFRGIAPEFDCPIPASSIMVLKLRYR